MKEKHGVTAIIYDEADHQRFFLLLHRVLNWSGWEFCKGGIDGDESPDQAVTREISEETGLEKIWVVSRLPQKISWASKGLKYVYTPFLVRAQMHEPIDLEQEIMEHDAYKWVPEKNVESMLAHEDNKKVFKEVLQILLNK